MKSRFLMTILAGMLVFSLVSAALAVPANENAGGPERVRVLIGFRNVPGPNERALVRAHGGAIKHSYHLVPAVAASIPETAIKGLSRNPNVTMIENDLTVYAIDDELDDSWGVKHIGAGTVHDSGNKGMGVKVAIIDSGINYNHVDLNANYVEGYDFVNDDDDPMDDHGHGTHVAGTVAAEDNGIGVVGVAPKAQIYGLKVLSSSGSGSYSDVIAALQWAVDHGIQVTNNSYGSSGYPGFLTELAFDLAEDADIINVCAAGNSGAGDDTVIYPARFGSCIAVAATTSSNVRAYFSSTGPAVEISAPGYYIYSTIMGGGYGYKSGTSMASPHVAGVVALMINASVVDIRGTLATTADDLGATGWDPQYGYGLVNAVAAVGGGDPPPPDLVVAEFYGDTLNGDAPLGVQFYDLSEGNPTSWSWSFDDGGTSTAQDPFHTYTAAGTYTVSLTVTGPDNSDTETKIGYIVVTNPPAAPVADFVGSPQIGDVPLIVNFTDQSSGDIDSWSWNFGDGGSSTAENPSHTYSSAGPYTVSLTVTGPGGSDSLTKTNYITVNEPSPTAPVAAFSGSPTNDDAPLMVHFTNLSTGDIDNWLWNFGDGGSLAEPNPVYTYMSPGIYTVSLMVTGPGGSDIETKIDYITVTTPPQGPTSMHVHDLVGSKLVKGKSGKWQVNVTVSIYDENEDYVPNATVSGTWSGAKTGSASGVTGSNGTVTFSTGDMKGGDTVTFNVDNVTHSTLIYDPTDNEKETSITVDK